MTTAKSIPGLLRKLANTIKRALGGSARVAEVANQRRTAQCQRNAEALQQSQCTSPDLQAIAKAVAAEMDRQEQRRNR